MYEDLLYKIMSMAKILNSITFTIGYFIVLPINLLVKYCCRSESSIKDALKLPGPKFSLPFIGNCLSFYDVFSKDYLQTWLNFINSYEHPFRFWFFRQLWVIVSGPKDLEAVFLSENAVNKDPMYSFFGKTSEGIFIAEGQDWRTLRSLLNPAFHTKLLLQFLEVMVAKSNVLVKILEPEVGKKINVSEYIGRCMLDIICGTQMGVPTEELEYNTYDFLKNSSKTSELILCRFLSPHLHPTIIYKSSSVYKQLRELTKQMRNFAKMILTKRKLTLSSLHDTDDSPTKNQIYLDGVLTCFEGAEERSIIRKVTDILIAGSETTAVISSYAIVFMGMHPDIQDKVYQEQCTISNHDSVDITISTLAQMKYLEMVIKEVLRLYTVPGIVKKLTSPVMLENGVELPARCSVYMSIYAAHRDPKYWAHPLEFYPDHFLPENVAARPKYSFIPFSSGPRNCPGMKFGYLAIKTVLSTIVRKYKIDSDLKMDNFTYKLGLTLELKGGYPVKLTKR